MLTKKLQLSTEQMQYAELLQKQQASQPDTEEEHKYITLRTQHAISRLQKAKEKRQKRRADLSLPEVSTEVMEWATRLGFVVTTGKPHAI
jgi:hypothetical protein